ncbi:M81 family metallopeptidase [Paramixta manurensis]|uniref:M81 family metallopeptidase n=1 Tax=Paramixta manurensis TaxID=2740817 RepID=A0A6M8UR71_9GAMM|nr:M81 family metallopeptidase [Erwiniaceae bacterium PD-1]
MKIAIGALLYEGNSFSLGESGIDQFENNYFYQGDEIIEKLSGGDVELSGALAVLKEAACEIQPLFATHGGCGGSIREEAFQTLKSNLLAGLAGEKVDGVYLALHGAMLCKNIAHPEVEILQEVRKRVGPNVPVVISLDLHAHITPELLALCTAVVGYQHYPHDDTFETGVRGMRLLIHAMQPTSTVRVEMKKLAMLISPTAASTHSPTTMRDLYKRCRALEALPGILAVSYFPLTPWAEYPDGGTAFVLVADEKAPPTRPLLDDLCRHLWDIRDRFIPRLFTLEEALNDSLSHPGNPIILSEMSDAVGAGSTGDSVSVLKAYIQQGRTETLLVQVVDPQVVEQATQYGIGSNNEYQIGHKVEVRNGGPALLRAEVVGFHSGEFTYTGGIMAGITSSVGRSVVLKAGHITLFVTSKPAYEYGAEQYSAAGLELHNYRYVVVKNPMNYRKTLAWAKQLYALDSPGSARADLTKLEWMRAARPFYPIDDSETPLYR